MTVVMHRWHCFLLAGDLRVDTETCNYGQRAVGSDENLGAATPGEASLALLNLDCSDNSPGEV